jgi:putative flippase GtrA
MKKKIKKGGRKRDQIWKYFLVGTLGTIVQLSLLYFFVDLFKIQYLISATLVFLIAVTMTFFLNRAWTFHVHDQEEKLEYLEYVGIHTGVLILNLSLMYFLVDYFTMWYVNAQLIAIVFLGGLSFILQRRYTFRLSN